MELKGLKERKRISNGLSRYLMGGDGTNTPGSVGGFYNSNPDINGSVSNASGFTGGFVQPKSPLPLNPKEGLYPIDPQVQDYMNNPSTGSPTNGYSPQNTNTQPSSAAGAGPWFALGEWAGTGVLSGLNAIGAEVNTNMFANQYKNLFLADAGTAQGSIGGVNYEQQNLVDDKYILNKKDEFWREALTSWLTNPFKAATMMIGKNSYYDKLAKAQEIANNEAKFKNSYNSNLAMSQFLNMQTNKNLNSLMLYAKNGKDSCAKYSYGKTPYMTDPMQVVTPWGQAFGKPNAVLAKGEVVADNLDGDNSDVVAQRLGNTKSNKDTIPAVVYDSTFVGTNKNGISDMAAPFANNIYLANKRLNNKKLALFRGKLGKDTDKMIKDYSGGMIKNVRDLLVLERNAGLLPKNKQDVMLHAASGAESWVPIINSLSNMGGAIGQYIKLKREDIKKPETYRRNPYGAYALQGLNNLRINPYPAIDLAREQERFGRYNINQSGGLSGSQKALANVALSIGTNKSLADLMANIDEKNLAYRNNYYSKAFDFGERERAAATDAARWDLDYYSKAEAAKRGMMNVAWNNIFTQKDQGMADYLKYRLFLDTYHLYDTGKMK